MFILLFSYLMLLRTAELILAERNRHWAIAHGGKEWDRGHYRVIVAVHLLFYLSLWLEWRYGAHHWNGMWPVWLGLLAVAQILRGWAILTLGRCWNTRIIVVPDTEMVMRGPYRFIRHPNYAAIILEFFSIPILCGAYFTAVFFSLLNAWILTRRIPQEERALQECSGHALPLIPRFIPRFARMKPSA